MKPALWTIIAFAIGAVLGYEIPRVNAAPDTARPVLVGRYQFAGVSPHQEGERPRVYRLDTSTGDICEFLIDPNGDLMDTTSCAH